MHRDNKSETMVMTEALLCEKMKCSVFCLACPGGSSNLAIWGFPKIRGTFLGVPIIRTIVYWGLYWGTLILGNYHIVLLAFHGVSTGRRVFRAFEFKVGRPCFPESLKSHDRFASSPLTAEKGAT